MSKFRIPFTGGGKERGAGQFSLPPLPRLPIDEQHRESVVSIWAMGQTPLDIVEGEITKQFPALTDQDRLSMMQDVAKKRGMKLERESAVLPPAVESILSTNLADFGDSGPSSE